MTGREILSTFAVILFATSVVAHEAGPELGRFMAEIAPSFESVSDPIAPDPVLRRPDGETLRLEDLNQQIVVLSFVSTGCDGGCAAQQTVLAAVQAQVNVTPMRGMATFLTIQPSAGSAFPLVLAGASEQVNWQPLALRPGSDNAADLSQALATVATRPHDKPLTYVIDRGGKLVAVFHGTGFGQVNMLLYINALTNARAEPVEPEGIRDRLVGWLQ